MLDLAIRSYGDAGQQAIRLGELVTAWDDAGLPRTAGFASTPTPPGPPPDTEGSVHTAQHMTFVVTTG